MSVGTTPEAASLPGDAAERLHTELLSCLYSDLPMAERLADACAEVAEKLGDPRSRAFAARSAGHVAHLRGNHEAAARSYREAARLFEAQGDLPEVGRTLSSGLQALSYLGRYEEAAEWTDRAEAIFLREGDVLRLARLDSNAGNIHFRQDRPGDALVRYERALEGFREIGSAGDTVAVLSNLAVCHTNLGDFAQALNCYERARQAADEAGLSALAAKADYNVAFLFYQRGDYCDARRLYALTRNRCGISGDAYHAALCDLDEAEMNLELNLTPEGEGLARAAARQFHSLGMRYEQAKALVSLAVAESQRGNRASADRTLLAARRLFVLEKNAVWTAHADQLRAVLAFHDGRFERALRLSNSAWTVLTRIMVPGRAAHSQILLARLWLRAGHADRARAVSREAVERLGPDISPSICFHASLLEGEIHEARCEWRGAWDCYQAARREVEELRGRVEGDDLRISVLKDKVAVYEALVSLFVDPPVGWCEPNPAGALELVQEAKSRSLADRTTVPQTAPAEQEDLTWLYRRLNAAGTKAAPELRTRVRGLEDELRRGPAGAAWLARLADLKTAIPEGAWLLEYFEARGTLHVFLVSREKVLHRRLGSSTPSRNAVRLLQFQLGKFRTGRADGFGKRNMDAVHDHLRELYQLLIGPVEQYLKPSAHLIIAPHRFLHSLPFGALHDGDGSLIDRFTLSAIPSSQVFLNCRRRDPGGTGASVVMAIADAAAPQIAREGEEVRDALPGARLWEGAAATTEVFRRSVADARIVHLATHGHFRRDNPLYSSLQFGDAPLNLAEIQEIPIASRLVTLSACNSGFAVTVGADELLGLMRGFLTAGARSMLLALWEIDDQGTRLFMEHFYAQLNHGTGLAAAHSHAARALRLQFAHPYYWAPFLLVGDPEALNSS